MTLEQTLQDFIVTTKSIFLDTDKKFAETDKKFQETDRQMKNLMKKSSEFDSNWGKLIEAFFEPAVLRLFKKRGIDVSLVTNNITIEKYGRQVFELDMLLRNGDSVVVIEVKTTLLRSDVNEHIEKRLLRFKDFFPEYNDKKIYGAVAFIKAKGNADLYAAEKGLFVLTFSGKNLIVIKNDKDYQPRDFRVDES